ncbi:hypothetical protein AM438_15640 [Proteus mirabilis]|uniref:hypothetical protein n=1 Tax=Proteus mirabilis TaxID=584 RepID=UPI0009AF13C1|nr:hypothetical protein [Proteus mirabilis]ARA23837.1 hypothetical protein AM438_15575 [Proteus mirabilis]ARA23848.1 hypothetical protein AM438_15640 [Proteus mirabilis]
MNIIYFDYIEGFGINANLGVEWNFYRSFDELVKEFSCYFSDNFILAPITAESGDFIGYQESYNV